jgi:parallel beta-helix repeat protein
MTLKSNIRDTHSGIYLAKGTSYAQVDNCFIQNFSYGIFLADSAYATLICNNTFEANRYSIKLTGPHDTVIVNNKELSSQNIDPLAGESYFVDLGEIGVWNALEIIIENNNINDVRSSSQQGAAIRIGQVLDVSIAGNVFENCDRFIYVPTAPENALISGNIFKNALIASIDMVNAARMTIVENLFEYSDHDVIHAQNSSEVHITDNRFYHTSGSGQVKVDYGGNSDWFIRNNLGYKTENAGVARIEAGQTSVLVPHGLDVTPAFITATPTSSLGAATKFWVNSISPTTFRINIDINTGAGPATFSWKAQ